jgi:hypothetical protein
MAERIKWLGGQTTGSRRRFSHCQALRLTPAAASVISGHVPKSVLISTMESRIHTAELKVAKGLLEAGPLKEELLDFERHVFDSGRTTWSTRVGRHDDIVLATALATWWAVKTAKPSWTSQSLTEATTPRAWAELPGYRV